MQYDERWLADALATRAYGASGPIQVLKVSRGTPGSLVGIVFGVGPITGEGWINSLPEAWDDVPWFVRFEMQTDDGTPVFHLLRFPNLVITGARSTPLAPPVPPPLPVRGGPQDAPGRGARESVPEAPLIPPGEPPPPPATRPPPARPPVQSPAQRRLAMLNRRDLRAAPGPPKGPDTLHALPAFERSAARCFLSEEDDADDPSSDSPPAPPPPPPPPPGPGARQPAFPEDATLRSVEGKGPGIKLRVLVIDTGVTLSHKHTENPGVGRRLVVADRDADIGLIWCWAPEAFPTVDSFELGRTYLLTDVLVKPPAAGRGNPPFYLHYGLRTKRRCMPAHLDIAYPPAVAVRSRRTANWFQEYS
ncbi:MAG: hypothetical protein LBS56_09405, partial [Propionibacteriaceae bacterium]|nr:hypothetical protein [Propionibacteriaceae bacterium]